MRRRVLRVIRVVWIAAGLSLTAWMYWGFQADSSASEAMHSDSRVEVVANDTVTFFRPRFHASNTGVIFLPGGMVEPSAYAPLLRRIAEAGHPVHLLHLPLRCACTDSQVGRLFDQVTAIATGTPGAAWVLAGHSRGGMLASRYVHERGPRVAALGLIATTHPRDFDLSDLHIPVTKIFGTHDGVASQEDIRKNRNLLPRNTEWIAIEGGNHLQFGYYRHQLGDNSANISRHDQQRATTDALLALLKRIG